MLVEDNFDIIKHTSFKIGGKINKVYFPQTFEDFLSLPQRFYVAGNLSNTLISSYGCEIPVVSTSKFCEVKINGNKIIAGAGVKGPKLSQIALENGLSGLEFMIGFPGSVGGEVYMNAGANGQSISDIFVSADIYFKDKGLMTLYKNDMKFGYRKSVCQDLDGIVLMSEFELNFENKDIIKKRMDENLAFRRQHQPSLTLPNCGSVFKNPENHSAGKLLDECRVKELKIGGAKVWENHANFIINDGGATSIDVLELMCEMKKRVKDRFGIDLKPEICFLGGNNEKEEQLCKILYQK